MHFFLGPADCESFLLAELRRTLPGYHEPRAAGLIASEFVAPAGGCLPPIVFARQWLPDAQPRTAPSIQAWAALLADEIVARLPDDQPWRMHVVPHYGSGDAGQRRCELIHEAVQVQLRQRRRHRLKQFQPDTAPFRSCDSLVQLLLTAPEAGLLSLAPAPLPFLNRSVLAPFPKGEVPVASDKAAPSRAFAKVVEAELRLGRPIAPGETCVDLGAAPGSWSYVALNRGARVMAVDRAPLREDLMRHPRLEFHRGDAFQFVPDSPVDWLLCDVIAAPARSIELVLDWAARRACRRFIVTIKFKGHKDYAMLDRLKREMPPRCTEFFLLHLCANKNEACAFGEVAGGSRAASP